MVPNAFRKCNSVALLEVVSMTEISMVIALNYR
jgi:hypothetical protein